jgi:nucleotide-binding universal stress UspA family protein
MQPFKHILVPTDFASSSARAVETAVALARTFDADLTLMHAWEIPVYPYMEFVLETPNLVMQVEDAASKRLADALADVQKSLPRAKSILKMGIPWQQIIDAIKEANADLVVMGTHGRHGLGHALLGSVAERVVRLSTVPVMTVHGRTTE